MTESTNDPAEPTQDPQAEAIEEARLTPGLTDQPESNMDESGNIAMEDTGEPLEKYSQDLPQDDMEDLS
jgi:hypothetical protein